MSSISTSSGRSYSDLGSIISFGSALLSGLFMWKSYKNLSEIKKRGFDRYSEYDDDLSKELEDRLDVYETRITLMEKKLSSMASHEKRISGLGVRVSGMQDYGQRIFQVEHQERQMKDNLSTFEERLNEVEQGVNNNTYTVKNYGKRLESIEMGKPVYTFFPGPSNGTHTGPNGILPDIMGSVHEPPIVLGDEKEKKGPKTPRANGIKRGLSNSKKET